MSDPVILLDVLIRGVACGALAVTGLAILRAGMTLADRLIGVATCVSLAAWVITESHALWPAFARPLPLVVFAWPVAGLFWLLVLAVFDDRPITPVALTPVILLEAAGAGMMLGPPGQIDVLWAGRNLAGGLLAIHAGVVVLRGWRGDLIEGRRQLRAPLLGAAVVFTLLEVGLALVDRLHPMGDWMLMEVGEPIGGGFVALLSVVIAVLCLQLDTKVVGAPRTLEAKVDSRVEAADRVLLERLDGLMSAEGWRREGLSIGLLADELGAPEHRLRRVINQRLGHRNFAEFLNSHRIEAAKRRLSDPSEARHTVAAIAFDLGYGSLGPFNRAFRAATGVTPSEWRRAELAKASPNFSKAV